MWGWEGRRIISNGLAIVKTRFGALRVCGFIDGTNQTFEDHCNFRQTVIMMSAVSDSILFFPPMLAGPPLDKWDEAAIVAILQDRHKNATYHSVSFPVIKDIIKVIIL